LLIDEIGDLDIGLQAKLLRAIERSEVKRLGGKGFLHVDVRIIAATRRDLDREVQEGRFRDDLFFRLAVARIELPPLRKRRGDITLLTRLFWSALDGPGAPPHEIEERFEAYAWPGNVRELRNCIERAVALTRYEDITVDDLPERIRDYRPAHVIVAGDDPTELVTLEEIDRRYILRVLEAVAGNKTLAARILDLDRRTLYRRLESYGIDTKKDG
ncbi:MAG: sigma 54-interacting transcriptional regulator, partial [Polyangiales bacterium]